MLTSLRHELIQKTAEVKSVYLQRDERVKAIADLECTVNDLEDDQDNAAQSHDRLVQDLAAVENEIVAKEKNLQDILPKLAAIKDKETKAKKQYHPSWQSWSRLDEAQGEESRLRAKQGRQVQFKSKADRDKAITQEVQQVQQLVKRKDQLLKDMTSKAQDLDTQIGNVESDTLEMRAKVDGRKATIDELSAECREAEEEKAKLDDERR